MTNTTAPRIAISFGSENGTIAPLFKVYPQQLQPQPAYLEFDPEADELALVADYSGEIGGAVPANVWNGLIQRFDISPRVLRSEIETLADDEKLAALLERVKAGFSSDPYDGASYTDDAKEAISAVEDLLRGLDEAEVWDADDWVTPGVCIEAAAEKASFDEYAAEFNGLEGPNQVISGDIPKAVARALSWAVECRSDEKAHKVAQMLAAYDADEYASLLEDFE